MRKKQYLCKSFSCGYAIRDMNHYTYVLFSPSRRKYYVGQSNESLEYAVFKHNARKRLFTRRGVPWQLVYSKQFEDICEAYLLTKQLKKVKSRKFMRYFIDHLMYKEKYYENDYPII
jgi:putative endonuclease